MDSNGIKKVKNGRNCTMVHNGQFSTNITRISSTNKWNLIIILATKYKRMTGIYKRQADFITFFQMHCYIPDIFSAHKNSRYL